MDWLKIYHQDHKTVLVLLAKFTGNVLDLKAGLSTPHTFVEFREFTDVIKNVIIPHFQGEETGLYKQVIETGPSGREFINHMLKEHEKLYVLFEVFTTAVANEDTQKIIEISTDLDDMLRRHIMKEEDDLPKFLD